MHELLQVRQSFGGGTFVTSFPDGLLVPWKPLSLQDYLQFNHAYQQGLVPLPFLEDEIFCKCVVDQVIVRNLPTLKAGVVQTVVQNIWEHSGPSSVRDFNQDLALVRELIFGSNTSGLSQLVETISMAFPYTPEEIYAMDYETLLRRAVMAESKLMRLGILKEPIYMQDKSEPAPARKRPNLSKEEIDRSFALAQKQLQTKHADVPVMDAKRRWEEEHPAKSSRSKAKRKTPPRAPERATGPIAQPHERPADAEAGQRSPVLTAKRKAPINFRQENAQLNSALGKDPIEAYTEREQMLENTLWVYKDLISAIAQKNK